MERCKLKIFNLSLFCLLLCLLSSSCNKPKISKVYILSGETNGFYYSYLNEIRQELSAQGDSVFDLIPTPGSGYNLNLLTEKRAHMAIVQGDLIPDNFDFQQAGISGVTPVFPEKIFIFRLLSDSSKPEKKQFNQRQLESIYIGSQLSGTNHTAKRIGLLAGISMNDLYEINPIDALKKNINLVYRNEIDTSSWYFVILNEGHSLIKDISDGYLDDSTLNVHNQSQKILDKHYNNYLFSSSRKQKIPVSFLEFSDTLINSLTSLFPIYKVTSTHIKIDSKSSFDLQQPSFISFIITQNDIRKGTVSSFLSSVGKSDTYLKSLLSCRILNSEIQPKWYIPIHSEVFTFALLKKLHFISNPSNVFRHLYLIFFSISLILLFSLAFPDHISSFFQLVKRPFLSKVWSAVSSRKGIIVLSLFFLLFFLGLLFVFRIERMNADLYGYSSKIAHMNPQQIILWAMVLIVTGYEVGIFPSDPTSVLIILLINLTVRVILPVLFLVFAGQWLKNFLNKKGGLDKRSFKKHIILLGWNPETPALINELISIKSDVRIVIIDEMKGNPFLDYKLPARNVGFISGSPFDHKVLNQANFDKAQHIFYLVNNKDHYYGYPVSFNNFYKELIKKDKIINPPPFSVINISNKYNEIYDLLNLELSGGSFPKLYYKLIENLFSGSSALYSQVEKWLTNIHVDDPSIKYGAGSFIEITYLQKNNNRATSKFLEENCVLLDQFLGLNNSEELCRKYKQISESFIKTNLKLLGIRTTVLVKEVEFDCILIEPSNTKNDEQSEEIFIDKLVLYLMQC